jgi:hypothetical protein
MNPLRAWVSRPDSYTAPSPVARATAVVGQLIPLPSCVSRPSFSVAGQTDAELKIGARPTARGLLRPWRRVDRGCMRRWLVHSRDEIACSWARPRQTLLGIKRTHGAGAQQAKCRTLSRLSVRLTLYLGDGRSSFSAARSVDLTRVRSARPCSSKDRRAAFPVNPNHCGGVTQRSPDHARPGRPGSREERAQGDRGHAGHAGHARTGRSA